MPRRREAVMEEGMVPKIRKRGCSSSSSTSSRVHHYRFKRAILVGKARNGYGLGPGLGGSRSSTPVPTWKMTAVESPKYSQSGRSRPVSARRLAATLWEMNEMPTPKVVEKLEESKKHKKMMLKREKMRSGLSGSGSFPPHLSDPSHSPVSERMDQSGTGSRQRRTSVISQGHKPADHSFEVLDSVSSVSLMEVETKSRAHALSESVVGVKTRLKDVSNALTTSKELLKIINRIWAHADQPSSSMSLVSALHAELERARLLVNQLIQEQRSDQNEISYLMKCFAEEKAAWKNKEQQAVEAAVKSIAGELEVERKLRQRFESFNKKLGKELAETKASFLKVVKELEGEKRAREITEQVCDELAKNIGEDKYKMEELKRESAKLHEEVEKEREMLQLADKLREERVQMKLSEARHQFEEKNSAINKLRKQLEAFLGKKRAKEKGSGPQNSAYDQDALARSSASRFALQLDEVKEDDGGEVEDAAEEDGSTESDLHSIELNMDNKSKCYKWAHASVVGHDSEKVSVKDEMEGRNSYSGQVSWRKPSLQRSISDVVEWDLQTGDGLGQETLSELEKQIQRKALADKTERHQSVNYRADQLLLSNSRAGSVGDSSSPIWLLEQPWSSRASFNAVQERSSITQGSRLKSRLAEIAAEGQNMRRSKR